jgi:hypothetical protein
MYTKKKKKKKKKRKQLPSQRPEDSRGTKRGKKPRHLTLAQLQTHELKQEGAGQSRGSAEKCPTPNPCAS